jgi:hypothetical protein
LKIKEYFSFLPFNLNLGILSKNIIQNMNNIIEFNIDNEENEINILKNQIELITKKYLKYKKKYYKTKLLL